AQAQRGSRAGDEEVGTRSLLDRAQLHRVVRARRLRGAFGPGALERACAVAGTRRSRATASGRATELALTGRLEARRIDQRLRNALAPLARRASCASRTPIEPALGSILHALDDV